MNAIEAKIIVANLIARTQTGDDGSKFLKGAITEYEIDALRFLSGIEVKAGPKPTRIDDDSTVSATAESSGSYLGAEPILLNLSSLSAKPVNDSARICIDFGTAMSKATLIDDGSGEEIKVLKIGIPGDQEEISEFMLISCVYIDDEGTLHFGSSAEKRSLIEGESGVRYRLDNIKRRLSEDGWDLQVGAEYNPTKVAVTYGELILAYLSFMTWAVNVSHAELGYGYVMTRRFALPCFDEPKRTEVVERLRVALGEAQVLADTFGDELREGVQLRRFLSAVREVQSIRRNYWFVDSGVLEPLGVAGSLVSWGRPVNSLVLVIDVGAGTTDLGLFRIYVGRLDVASDDRTVGFGVEVEGSYRVLTEAGNYLDRVLEEYVMREAGISSEHPYASEIRGRVRLEIRRSKERLFDEGNVDILVDHLGDQLDVHVEVGKFCELPAVKSFGESLRNLMVELMESVDDSFMRWVHRDARHYLTLVLTGGGSGLPMVRDLAKQTLMVHGRKLRVELALDSPKWLEDHDISVQDYSRAAVSLGGARRELMKWSVARVTAA